MVFVQVVGLKNLWSRVIRHNYALYVLLFHIAVALISLVIWTKTIWKARKAIKAGTLPGASTLAHKKAGQLTFIGIFLTAFTGIWVYVLLFEL